MKHLFSLLMIIPALLNAQSSQGPFNASLAENTSCPFSYSSTLDYEPAENVFASDNEYAKASHCDCCDANTRCFQTSRYGFAIPASASIQGIMVEVEKKASSGSIIQDNGVKLMKTAIATGSSYATADNWPYTDAYSSYGGAADLWGAPWIPADINDDGFGLVFATISYTCFGNNVPAISYIDHIRITVYFTDLATGLSSVASSNGSGMVITENPVGTGEWSLAFPAGERNIHILIMDVEGKIISEKKMNALDRTVKFSPDLPRGIYILSAIGELASYVQKVVVE